ncbi:MAG: hypothetical protein JAZ03_11700 [Candidatus Thiodiazotropha taylori]|nr:hypothetical protein [Candidatus Thiodiazotropha taylori]MCW4334589.1 hypothetical protein [Candidatus Thiodiazotropha endolucinida]
MQELTGIKYETSEQHKEMSNARQVRDVKDTLRLLGYLQDRKPFSSDQTLRSVTNGVVAEASVNVDRSHSVGTEILESMVGKDVQDYVFKKSKQAITLGARSSIQISDESVQVDPQLLFQGLVTAGDRIGELPLLFSYELCSYPAALFESSSLPLQANKPALADAILKLAKLDQQEPPDDVQYVLDGVHYCTVFHGHERQPTAVFVHCMLTM